MATVEVFDPPMCCSTGVCGPSIDPTLVAFAADLGWLAGRGVAVERHNLSQEPKLFADSDLVRELLVEHGDSALPAVVVDGALRSSGRYPSREELVEWSRGGARSEGVDAVTPAPTFVPTGEPARSEGACCGGSELSVELTDGEGVAAGGSGCCSSSAESTEVPLSTVGAVWDATSSRGCCG